MLADHLPEGAVKNSLVMDDSPESIARDIATIGRIGAIPSILRLICSNTGLGFAAVARVTNETWTACAVEDTISFGLRPGGQLDLRTTLCFESRAERQPVVIDHASEDPVYREHHTPRIYQIESYISVPIVLSNGIYFGNLCAIDRHPAKVSDPQTLKMFEVFSQLVALQLESESRQQETEAALLSERETADLREQFIAVLSHDLRNPLAAVSATADLLSRRKNEPDLVTIGQRLRATTSRMAHLIDDLMDFARGRLGSGIGVTLAACDSLGVALQDVVTELSMANPGRTVVTGIAVDQSVFCDRARVQQLLSNLLGNALTHGAPDIPVTVNAFIEEGSLNVAVCNGGDLISPDNLQKVFEPYWRPASSAPGGGLGLGLYICKQIVRAHRGNLEVVSSSDKGTCFTARIPVAP